MDLKTEIREYFYKIHGSHIETDIANIIAIAEKHIALQLQQTDVSGSTLLPDGWKVYKCTDCQEINIKKDNRQITVGFCDNCEHPLWNDDVD